jgi:hypothetical protein
MQRTIEPTRRDALQTHNETFVLPRMLPGQVWKVWVYEKQLQWGELPPEFYFILIAPRSSEVAGAYTLMRSHLRYGRVAKIQLAGVSVAFSQLRDTHTARDHTNWSGELLRHMSRPFIFAPEPVSWAPWED